MKPSDNEPGQLSPPDTPTPPFVTGVDDDPEYKSWQEVTKVGVLSPQHNPQAVQAAQAAMWDEAYRYLGGQAIKQAAYTVEQVSPSANPRERGRHA